MLCHNLVEQSSLIFVLQCRNLVVAHLNLLLNRRQLIVVRLIQSRVKRIVLVVVAKSILNQYIKHRLVNAQNNFQRIDAIVFQRLFELIKTLLHKRDNTIVVTLVLRHRLIKHVFDILFIVFHEGCRNCAACRVSFVSVTRQRNCAVPSRVTIGRVRNLQLVRRRIIVHARISLDCRIRA